jgi:translation initiation factor eIF-2B subunit alpha
MLLCSFRPCYFVTLCVILQDLPLEHKPVDVGPLLPRSVAVDNPSRDYTPPAYINLLVTDLGVLTPAAVSDELIQLYV